MHTYRLNPAERRAILDRAFERIDDAQYRAAATGRPTAVGSWREDAADPAFDSRRAPDLIEISEALAVSPKMLEAIILADHLEQD